MKNFNRQYRMSAGQASSIGFEIGGEENPLHISFSCEKADTESSNSAKVSVWNLNKEHIAELNKKDCIVSLRAGYGTVMPLIFAGVVTFAKTKKDGSSMVTDIELTDSRIELRDTYISLSYVGKVNCQKIMQDIAGSMGVTAEYSYNANFDREIPNGYSYVGSAANALTKICKTSGLVWIINNGILQIKKPNDTMSREVYVLSAETGLIGMPERVQISDDENSENYEYGYDVEFLMNAAINIDDFVYLDSIYVKGYFRVYSVSVSGDNYEGSWSCTARLLEVKPL